MLLALFPAVQAQTVNFGSSGLSGESSNNPTSLQFGPDERLYVSQQDATIYAYTIARNSTNDYDVTATETINLIKNNVPNHNDDGAANATNKRQVTGILVAGTASNPVLYVTSSDWRIAVGNDSGLDTNSGVLTRLTCSGGMSGGACQGWDEVDLVRGLPRSEENHSTNGLDLDESTNTLYVMSGGHANKGAPSNNFSGTPEYYLSAALLSVDLDALDAMPVYTDPRSGRSFVYDLRTLDDPQRANIDNTSPDFPYPVGHPLYASEVDPGDPFGGNNGLNQAIPEPGGPVQIYAPGFRNAYDVVFTQAGELYTSDNGPNGGWGGTALVYDNGGTLKGSAPGIFNQAAGDYCTNEFNEANSNTHGDPLFHISGPGFYGGHQAPIRAFPDKAGVILYEEISGSWVETASYNFADLLPADLSISDFPGNPIECEYSANDPNKYLDIVNASTNGITEYTASNFNGALEGNLLTASFNGNIYRYELNAAGDDVVTEESLFSGFGSQPLDVIAQGDGDIFAGTVWAVTYGANNITVFEPQDFGACDTSDPSADADADGYTNGDEADNGTNACSGGSKPNDFDGDLVSDLNDDDDDGDGILDVVDVFALDADNGTATGLPANFPLWNNDPGTGLFGLGFTGLMLPEDGTTTWLDLFDENNLAAGGATGKLTVEAVPHGDTYQNENAGEYGFLFGVDLDTTSPAFVVRTQLEPPFFAVNGSPSTPTDWQSFGMFVGTGDQDNFVKVVFNANGGNGGVEVAKEVGGSASGSQYDNGDWGGADILASSEVDLYLLIDPQALTAQPQASVDGGATVYDLGSPVSIPAAWLDPNDGQGLAVGTIATANSPGDNAPEFGATWDLFEVYEAPSETAALVQVTPTGTINKSTFSSNSLFVENLSAAANITSVTFDVSTAALQDVVFDPNGTAGDATSKDLSIDSQTGGDSSVGFDNHTFSSPNDGGFAGLTITFTDFEPGETVGFSIDMDPTTINGTSAPGPGESGSVSGLELTGSTVTVAFSDGSTQTATLFRGAEGDGTGASTTVSGAENLVRTPEPAGATVDVDGVALSTPGGVPSHFKTATVGQAQQTIRVDAPVGSTVRLLAFESALFEQAGGGNDVDPFETNSFTAVDEQTATVTSPGGVDFTVTLAPVDENASATTTHNIFVAAVEDPADGMTGPVSDVVVLAYDPTIQPAVLFRVNAGGALVAATDGEIDWIADQGSGGSEYLVQGGGMTNGFPTASLDASVPAGTPSALYATERWDPSGAPEMLYSFPTGNGDFAVRLYLKNGFGGTSGPGDRVFDINLEGGSPPEIAGLDLSATYGHQVGAMIEVPITVADGTLDIEFIHDVENTLINAIEILGGGSPVANNAPVLDPIGDQASQEGDVSALTVTATDPDAGQNLTYAAAGLPAGLDIEPTNGQVFGTIAVGAAAGSPYTVTVTVTDDGSPALSDSETFMWTVTAAGTSTVLYRVNNGGPQLAATDGGPAWGEDQAATGSGANGSASVGTPSPYLDLTPPAVDKTFGPTGFSITNSTGAPDDLFAHERFSDAANPDNMGWDFPVADGSYEVNLYFAENWSGASNPGVRVFDVQIEGVTELDDYDPYVAAGNQINVATKETFVVAVSDGTLDIDFVKGAQNPALKGIEIVSITGTANNAPVLDPIDDVSLTAGDEVTNIAVSATDADAGDTIALSVEVVDDGDSSVVPDTDYTFTDNGDGTGFFTWPTQSGDAGSYTATVTATDGIDPATESFAITVVPHIPTITLVSPADGATITADSITVTWTTTQLLESDHVHAQLDTEPHIGSLPQNGSYTFTGVAPGQHTITVRVAEVNHGEYQNPEAIQTITVTVAEPAPAVVLHRVNVGGALVAAADGSSPDWTKDQGNFGNAGNSPFLVAMSTGGSTYNGNAGSAHPGPIVMTHPSLPAGVPASLFNFERYDAASAPEMQWAFPNIDPGTTIEVRLFFAELFSGVDAPGERVFDVEVEGVVPAAFDGIDAIAEAGPKGAFMRTHTLVVSDGTLDLTFIHDVENPALKGIEVLAVNVGPNNAPLVTNPGDQNNAEGDTVSLQIDASDDDGPQALAYSATDLPLGLSIDPATGLISGTIASGTMGSGAFQEQGGLVVIELESADNRPSNWVLGPDENPTSPNINNPGNATGGQFLVWEGSQFFGSPGNGLMTFPVEISTPGTYQFQWRNQVGNGTNATEHNDTWLKIEADAFYGEKGSGSIVCPKGYDPAENDCTGGVPEGSGSGGWFKVYSSGANNWSWSTNTSDNDAHQIYARFDAAGVYNILVSARSSSHVIDRMVMAEAGYSGNPTDTSLPESPRATGADGAAAGSPYDVTVAVTDGAATTEVEFVWTVGEPVPVTNPSAFVEVTPGAGLGASTFNNNSFFITNTGDVDITNVTVDASTAFMPDVVFDPVGKAGDNGAKCLTAGSAGDTAAEVGITVPANGGSGSDPDCVDVFAQPHNGVDDEEGYDVLTLDFTDFNPAEVFAFGVDMDPTSIKGDLSTGDAGSISGFENVGATVTVTFADGSVLASSLFDEGSLGGAQAVIAPDSSMAPVLGTAAALTPLDGDRAAASVTDAAQTITVAGEAGAAFTLLQVDARLYIDPGNPTVGYDVDPFEANEAVAKVLYTGTLDGTGAASVPVTLLETPGSGSAPDGGLNHFIAVVDGQGEQTSQTSNVLILELGDTAAFPVAYAEGWNLVSLPAEVPDPGYLAVFEGGAGGDPQSPVFVVENTFFEFDGAYTTPDPAELTIGRGAWLKFQQAASFNLEGTPVLSDTLAFGGAGWALVGPPSCAVPASTLNDHPSIVSGTVYGFDGAYFVASTLTPGDGYWVKVADGASAFDLPVSCAVARPSATQPVLADNARPVQTASLKGETAQRKGAASQAAGTTAASRTEEALSGFSALRIADAAGYERTLHFGRSLDEETEAAQFALPPLPPAGAFDARFAGDARLAEATEATVLVQTAAYPLTVEVDGAEAEYELDVLVEGTVAATYTVASGTAVEIAEAGTTLQVRPKSEALPETFALNGAYPNPFRRQATVSFDLPEQAEVRLTLYDVLGRRVMETEGTLEAGAAHQLEIRAASLASGVYVFQLEAAMPSETVVETGRLTLVK